MLDRNKYKPVEVSIMKRVSETAMLAKQKLEFHKLIEGDNKFKFLPAHEAGGSFFLPLCVSWFPIEKEDGTETRRSVFDARVHGGKQTDLANEYYRGVLRFVESRKSEETKIQRAILEDYKTTPRSTMKFVAYAYDIKNKRLALLEFTKTTQANLISDMTSLAEDFGGLDPFTGLDDGLPITIVYNPKAVAVADKHKYSRSVKPFVITDEVLEVFESKPSLKELYSNSFKESDLKLQIDGIITFDRKYNIGYIKTDEWLSTANNVIANSGFNFLDFNTENRPVVAQVSEASAIVEEADVLDMSVDELDTFLKR